MTRNEEVPYEQDRLGNENRKLDRLRAQGGKVAGGTEGLRVLGSADTGIDLIVYSATADVDEAIVIQITAHNSAGAGGDFHLLEGDVDSNNAGQLSNTTRRSVDHQVDSNSTAIIEYEGKPFSKSVGVRSEFAGQVGVAVIEDHKEENSPNTEDTSTP